MNYVHWMHEVVKCELYSYSVCEDKISVVLVTFNIVILCFKTFSVVNSSIFMTFNVVNSPCFMTFNIVKYLFL